MAESNIEDLLIQLRALNNALSKRMSLYKQFNLEFEKYFAGETSEAHYEALCNALTPEFQMIATKVEEIEEDIRAVHRRGDLGDLIHKLRAKEHAKLNDSVRLQIYRIKNRNSNMDFDDEIEDIQKRLPQTQRDIQELWDELRHETAELSFTVES
ncbi:DNA repair REX1-B-domain-containing protein [Dichotomocladium elegans]|nr:DNA repair REX1-B-domain-containing protein [Dichotomocladium elegans]